MRSGQASGDGAGLGGTDPDRAGELRAEGSRDDLDVQAAMGVAGVVTYALVAVATRGLTWGVLFGRGKVKPA